MATTTTQIVRQYSDLDLNFTIHPVKKDINRNLGERAVINSVKNLILTNHYEKPFQPNIGSNIRRLLFENLDNLTGTTIESEIRQTILNFEPRVNLIDVTIRESRDSNEVFVSIEFKIVNTESPLSIDFFLERIR